MGHRQTGGATGGHSHGMVRTIGSCWYKSICSVCSFFHAAGQYSILHNNHFEEYRLSSFVLCLQRDWESVCDTAIYFIQNNAGAMHHEDIVSDV